MARKLLIILLVIALLFELALTGMSFFARETMLKQLGAPLSEASRLLGYIIAWFCLFVSLVCAFVLWQVVTNTGDYSTLCYLLGLWWLGIGIGIYIAFKRPDNLFTDSLKGLLLIIFTRWNWGKRKKPVYSS